jgi:hypothetical protein
MMCVTIIAHTHKVRELLLENRALRQQVDTLQAARRALPTLARVSHLEATSAYTPQHAHVVPGVENSVAAVNGGVESVAVATNAVSVGSVREITLTDHLNHRLLSSGLPCV